ncbi:MAG: zinc-finger domain-containing protein [Alphaproteobacteria bacterium]
MAREPLETVEVEEPVVACDGGEPALGHPRVFLNMGDRGSVDCPYCDRRFVLRQGAGAASEH